MLNTIREIMHEQQQQEEDIKKGQTNFRAEKGNNWTEKLTRGIQQWTWSRRINQGAQRLVIWNHPIRGAKGKRNETE